MNSSYILDGVILAQERERALSQKYQQFLVDRDRVGSADQTISAKAPTIAAVVFREDLGSMLYTDLKQEAATRLGFNYLVSELSLAQASEKIMEEIKALSQDKDITGIIIQKPRRQTWQEVGRVEGDPKHVRQAYQLWWELLTGSLPIDKDVDGLHPSTVEDLRANNYLQQGRVLPATLRAVLSALGEASRVLGWPEASLDQSDLSFLKDQSVAIVGRSDLLGKPLEALLSSQGIFAKLFGVKELERARQQGQSLRDFQVVVSATGVPGLLRSADLADGVVAIDVGEPKADLDFAQISPKVAFITPVPGGIGPLTVISLMENGFELFKNRDTINAL